jgi:hypothetical protein
LHAWRICLETGQVQKPGGLAACVRTFPVKLENGVVSIFVDPSLEPAEANGACDGESESEEVGAAT